MSQGQVRKYNPTEVIINVGGTDVSGYADGSFIEVERNVDAFTLVVGSDGESTRVKSANLSGIIKVTLQQSSPSNDYFSSLATADELNSGKAVPILMKDGSGTTFAQAKQGWVKKKANSTFASTAENREWTFECGALQYTVGGESTL